MNCIVKVEFRKRSFLGIHMREREEKKVYLLNMEEGEMMTCSLGRVDLSKLSGSAGTDIFKGKKCHVRRS